MPEEIKNKVNVFVIGDRWRHGPSLEALAPDTMRFFLAKGALSLTNGRAGTAVMPFNSYAVQDTLGQDYTYRSAIIFNHTDEFPLPQDGNENYLGQTPLLVFDSPPLSENFDLIGSPVGELYLSVSGILDADIEFQYYEVTAEGKSYPLSIAVQRLSPIDETQRVLLKDGEVRKYRLDNAYFMGKRLRKGSFVRATLRVITDAALQKNYGSGGDVSRESLRDRRVGKLRIHFGGRHNSIIQLPGSFVQ